MARILKNITISEESIPVGEAHCDCIIDVNSDILSQQHENETIEREAMAWQSGYTQGFSDGVTQEQTLLSEQTDLLTRLLNNIPQAINENRQQLSSDIADMVLLIVSKFFIHQQHNKTAIVHQITQVIMQLNEKQHLSIALHPHDLALLQKGDIHLNLHDHKNIHFTADERLRLGGCIVTSEHGVFDAGIERQIDQLKEVLLRMKSQHE